MTKRISYVVHGKVQGVFFRQWTTEQAQSLGVTGWVKNDSSGTVSGEAQGDDDKLKTFVDKLHNGPRHASVTKVEQSDIATKEGEKSFDN